MLRNTLYHQSLNIMQRLTNASSRILSVMLAAALMLSFSACDSDGISTEVDPVERTAAELVQEADYLSTLETAASESDAGLLEALGRSEPLTVFAPGNPAFANWDVEGLLANPALLADVIQYHVVNGSVTTSDLEEGQTLTSLQGTALSASANGVNGIGYFRTDQNVTNGTVHIVNDLLFGSRTIAERAEFYVPASSFFNAIESRGLTPALDDPSDDLTAFIPSEAALEELGPLIEDQGLSESDVVEILQYHVLPQSQSTADLINALNESADDTISRETLQGESVTFTAERAAPEEGEEQGDVTSVIINGGQATVDLSSADLRSSNGISHFVTGILLPEEYRSDATETIASTSNLSTLSTALEAAGLDATLGNRDAAFTVFAPSNDAFSAYDVNYLLANTDLLSDILTYHVVEQELAADDLEEGVLSTVQGDDITVRFGDDDAVLVNSAQVTQTNLPAVNGVIHVLDDVLLENQPVSVQLRARLATRTLFDNLTNAELADAVDGSALTVFAPTNDAFEGSGFQDLTFDERAEALQYHVLPSAVNSATLIDALESDDTFTTETLQGEDIVFSAERDDEGTLTGITINDGQASIDLQNVDIEAEESFIHLIDGVLLPSSFTNDESNTDA
jgi:uncharacterized surface protein with fasciclin (FAS1) repeats